MRRLKPFQIALIAVGGTVGTIGIALGISFIVDVVEVLNWEDVEVPINQVSNISYGDGSVTYEDDNFTIEISDGSAEEKEAFLADADNGSLVQGTTKDGKNFEGRGNTIFLNTNNRIAQATVENKKDMDIAKAAGVTGQIVTAAGYEEGADDWSTDCNTYNMVEADCVVYYPAELRLKAESEDKIVFEDSRSKAVMTIILTDNTYTCMDEVEEFLYSDYEGNVLASGTDWYTTLVTDNGMATYDYVGLGNDYIVDCSLQYETKYDYVFTDLCSLIRCAFNEDGQWVSNALADTTGETVAVLASDPEEYDPEMKRTSYMFTDYECAVYYPNVFTKAYKGEDGTEYFTDPHTGAYISFTKTKTSMTSQEELVRDNMVDFVVELKGSNAVKGKLTTGSEGCFSYRAVKDGYLYSLDMTYPMDYDYVYSNAYELLEIALYGEGTGDEDVVLMQDIYFNPFSANVTIPASFMEVRTDDDVHIFEDLYTGMIMEISFTELDEDAVYDNLNTVFNVQAEDGNVLYGEYYIKWHNDSGAWIGAVGARCACLIAIANSDAYPVFSNCWDSFAINFSDGETYDLPSDAVSEEVSELLEEQITSEGEDADASKENRTEAVTNEEASDEAVTDTADGDVTGEDRTEDDITDEDATDEDATDEDPAEDESDDTSEETKKNADEIGDYDSPYELMLMDAGDTYESLPFGKDSRISMDTVSYGQITVISYSLDTEDWESCKNDLYELLEEDFETVYSNEYSNDYLSGFQAYMTGYEAGNCADVELYFDIDSLQELKLMFYDKSGSTQPLKGKIMYSDSVLAEYESLGDLSGYEDFMTEMDNTMTELYNIYSEEEMMDRYMQVDYHTFSDTFYANADEWTLTYEIPSDLDSERMLEVGTYEGGSFHMQGMYYVSEIGNVYYMDDQTLYTVNDDGELNEAGPEEEY